MEAKPGTYVLVLRSDVSQSVQVGRWGVLQVRPGYYLYVGSAFGPGGVRARVLRHARKGKKLRWHVDYLREVTEFEAAWYSHAPQRLEHDWARTLAGMRGVEAVKGFGCSDCGCEAHLYFAVVEPDSQKFVQAVKGEVLVWEGN